MSALLLLVVPSCQVAVLIHSAITSCCAPLIGADLAAVAEGLKVLLLLSTCAAAEGEAAQVCQPAPCKAAAFLYDLHCNVLACLLLIMRLSSVLGVGFPH
jgi:hypothetical protein